MPYLDFPATPVLDDFNRADGGLGSNWVSPVQGAFAMAVVSNAAQTPSFFSGDAVWSANVFTQECEAFASMAVAIEFNVVYVRVADTNPGIDCYGLFIDGSNLLFDRFDNGISTQLGSTLSISLSPGNKFGIRAIGTQFSAYVFRGYWDMVKTATDSTYLRGGYIGMRCDNLSSGGASLDDFGGGSIEFVPETYRSGAMRGRRSSW